MKKHLLEADYKDFFSPKTMATLKGKSDVSRKAALGDENLMQIMISSQKLLNEIIKAEAEYRDELEELAREVVKNTDESIDFLDIPIEAKIVGMGDMDIQEPPPQNDPESPDFGKDDPDKIKAKRRVINSITQGASIRGASSYLTDDFFNSYINQINPGLIEKYNAILKKSFGIYDDDNAIAMMLAALAQGQKMQGGESQAEYDDETKGFIIKAKALCFPMLVHEIIKGLYEIIGTEGFGTDKEKNKATVNAVDKLSNEPEDLRYGKFIFDAILSLYVESKINDSRVRELFVKALYKIPDFEFFPFIENAINGELKPLQKKWAIDRMKDIKNKLIKRDAKRGLKGNGGL
jgi:hypothetical protein